MLRIIESRSSRESDNLLILLHGYGSDERDLMGLAPYFGSTWRTVCLGAPNAHPTMGYAWFDLDWSEDKGMTANLDQARETLALVVEALEDQLKTRPAHAIVGGFSQGAMMALAACAQMPKRWNGLALLSGRSMPIVEISEPLPPTIIQHGTTDPVIPLEDAHELRDLVQNTGTLLEYHEYAMGHQISEKSLHDLQAWLHRRTIA